MKMETLLKKFAPLDGLVKVAYSLAGNPIKLNLTEIDIDNFEYMLGKIPISDDPV